MFIVSQKWGRITFITINQNLKAPQTLHNPPPLLGKGTYSETYYSQITVELGYAEV